MSRRSSSTRTVPHLTRLSTASSGSPTLSRRLSTVENADGPDQAATHAQEAIHEEIDEIKRYEDFTTIDWVQDAAREQLRRRARRQERAGFFERQGSISWRRRVWEAYDAGQGWLVVTLIGATIGLIAAILNIATEWLSDIKLGYCTTAFYLNESFCCWGSEGGCKEWHRWSSLSPINYVFYISFATMFAFVAARLVKAFAPYAAGSGISEIKCIIAGFVMKGFLGFWTLLIKSIGLPLAIASGLSVGKEGPSVHYAVCTGNVISRLFDKYKRNASRTREVLSACAAAGVAVAFGSPIGGVLFSLEEMSSYFPLKTLWRSYFCALVATAVLAAMNPFRTGQLVMFQVRYDRSWHFFEIIFYIILGIFGGLYGAFMMKWNLRAQAFRKKYLTRYAVLEATVLAFFTAIVCYPNMFLRIDMTESMEILFRECEGDYDYDQLCESKNRWSLVFSLLYATVLRMFLVIISYGCKVPAGIFVPSMAIGASFGRTVGIVVDALHEAYPKSSFFSACEPDVPCITPGTYAFLGAGAALSGIMHITVSVVVIMFELTGALDYILPTMITVGVTKLISDRLSHGGIADRMIWFNGFPFLDSKSSASPNAPSHPVSAVMTPMSSITTITSASTSLQELERLLRDTNVQGFPIVDDMTDLILAGYIGRTELRYAVERARRDGFASDEAICVFYEPPSSSTNHPGHSPQATTPLTALSVRPFPARSPSPSSSARFSASSPSFSPSSNDQSIPERLDMTRFPQTPLTVSPSLPLETLLEIFRKLGPRIILVEQYGRLVGLATIKDCLKWQFRKEADEAATHGRTRGLEEALWWGIKMSAKWVRTKVEGWSGGRVKLGGDSGGNGSAAVRGDRGNGVGRETQSTFVVEDPEFELEERFPGTGTGGG